jgi:hypothetical protein
MKCHYLEGRSHWRAINQKAQARRRKNSRLIGPAPPY